MPKIVYPSIDAVFPVQRGEVRLSMLMRGHGYLVEDDVVTNLSDFAPKICDAFMRPPDAETERLLLLFPGGLGDVLCMRTVLENPALRQVYPKLKEIGFVSFNEDRALLGDNVRGTPLTLYDYPCAEEIFASYDSCVSYGTLRRMSIRQSLWESYAAPLKLPTPTVPYKLQSNPQLQFTMQAFLEPGRGHIGIQMTSPSFYKSWHPSKGYPVALTLAGMGFSVYLLGSPDQRLEITEESKLTNPHNGVHDMAGLFRSTDEIVAFVDCMDAVIAIDSGIMHIAGSLQKPTIALFSLTDAASRCGLYPTVFPLEAKMECSPCWNVVETPQCGHPFCEALGSIPASDIVHYTLQLLGTR